MKRRRIPMAAYILIGLVLGIVVGYMVFISYPDKKAATQIAGYIRSCRISSCA
jgi:hypothetical protein